MRERRGTGRRERGKGEGAWEGWREGRMERGKGGTREEGSK